MTLYPAEIDSSLNLPEVVDAISAVNATTINRLRAAIIAVETELGVKPSGVYGTVKEFLTSLNSSVQIINDQLQYLANNGTIFIPGKDLAGDGLNQTVVGIQGRGVSSTAPTDGQTLIWNNSASKWEPGIIISFTAGNDLSGTNTSQTVIGIQGRPVASTAPNIDETLVWNGSVWAPKLQNSSNEVVFRPGLPTQAPAYATWSEVVTAVQNIYTAGSASAAIIFDDYNDVCTIPAGTWDFGKLTKFVGNPTSADGSYSVVFISDGVVFTNSPVELVNISLNCGNTSPVITSIIDDFNLKMFSSSISAFSAPFYSIYNSALNIQMSGRSGFGGGFPVIETNDYVNIYLFDGSQVFDDSISGTGTLNYFVLSSSARPSKNQSISTVNYTLGAADGDLDPYGAFSYGNTASRPNLTGLNAGYRYFDTDVNNLVVWNGTGWDFAGAQIGGDLSNTLASPTVAKINGTSVPSSPSSNTVLVATSSSSSVWSQIYDGYVASNANITGSKIAGATTGSVGVVQLTNDLSGTSTVPAVVSLTGSAGSVNIASTGATLNWNSSASSPTLKQADVTTASATGQALTVQAQNATGTASTGGKVTIKSGTGTPLPGVVEFSVGSNLAGYFDTNRTLRIGPSSSTGVTLYTNQSFPNASGALFAHNSSGDTNIRTVSSSTSGRALFEADNASAGVSATVAMRMLAAGSADSITDYRSNGVVEQVGSSTSALLFSALTGDGNTRSTTGRIFQTGAWAIGSGSTNNTSSAAQAGLTGPVINVASSSGTFTSTSSQALIFNQSGSLNLQGDTDVRFNTGSSLKAYIDGYGTLRIGPNSSTSITAYTNQTFPTSVGAFFAHNVSGDMNVRSASSSASGRALFEADNVSGGVSSTVAMRMLAAGASDSVSAFQNNGVIEQVGSSTSALLFSTLTGNGVTRSTTGRIFQSGAWAIGDASNNNTSSGAQAGLTGAVINIASSAGVITSTANQAIIYNSSGTVALQGHAGHSLIANTTTVASTSTSKFITNVGRRIATRTVTANYTVTTSDEVIIVGAIAAGITITLPSSPTAGDVYVIKDQLGNSDIFQITVDGNGNNIDGASTYVINTEFTSITVVFANGTWSII